MIILSIDPGLRHSGMAVHDDGTLTFAALIKSPCKTERGPVAWVAMAKAIADAFPLIPDVLVVETMKIYRHGPQDPDDMLELQGVTGATCGLIPAGRYVNYLAKTWTDGVPKDVRTRRIQATWAPEDEEAVEWPAESLKHNVYDAIGLGRYAVRQIKSLSTEAA